VASKTIILKRPEVPFLLKSIYTFLVILIPVDKRMENYKTSLAAKIIISLINRHRKFFFRRQSDSSQSRSPSMPVRRLRVGIASSGELELIQACDWLTTDSTLDFQREFYACLAIVAKYKQSIWNFLSKI
jgi:hypothetical protein